MITRTATLISLAGVLVAGSAAALVNTQVLQDTSGTGTNVGSILAAPTTTLPATTATVVPITATTVAGAPASTISAFAVGDAGVVSTDSAGGVLTLASAVPNPGWSVFSSGTNAYGGVEVRFRSATVEVVFNAVLTDGNVVTSVGSSLLDSPTGTSIDDHGGDDDSSDDDHEDDGSDDSSDDTRDDSRDDSSDDSSHDSGDDHGGDDD